MLNHASLSPPDIATAVDWLRGVAIGMSVLVDQGVATPVIRSSRYPHEISCLGTWTLAHAYQALRMQGARDEYLFLLRLGAKAPLLDQAAPVVEDRFLRCESVNFTSNDGEPLLFCAVSGAISIGFPANPVWDQSAVTVAFNELLPDGTISEASETIDNLTRLTHARLISERCRHDILGRLSRIASGADLWGEAAHGVFPNLTFGLDVEKHLSSVNAGDLGTITNKLASLDKTAAHWRDMEYPTPPWRTKVTNEAPSVMNNPRLSQYRRFRSSDGSRQSYTWHARYGSGGRIHLRFVRRSYLLEIGYIGPHLPLAS